MVVIHDIGILDSGASGDVNLNLDRTQITQERYSNNLHTLATDRVIRVGLGYYSLPKRVQACRRYLSTCWPHGHVLGVGRGRDSRRRA